MDFAFNLIQTAIDRGPLVNIQEIFTDLDGDNYDNGGGESVTGERSAEFEFIEDI
jgi:hypothetical protein